MEVMMNSFLKHFNSVVEESEVFLFITRDTELQQDCVENLLKLKEEIALELDSAVLDSNEEYANTLLGCTYVASTLISSIQMWILLKENNPDQAWDKLIEAQSTALAAARSSENFRHLAEFYNTLTGIEKLVFPPQVFLSSGFIAKTMSCSICGDEYEDCPHVAGRPYMGHLCQINCNNLEVDHVAVVKHPADKRCRIINFQQNGLTRNRMTWRTTPSEEEKHAQGMQVQAILAVNSKS